MLLIVVCGSFFKKRLYVSDLSSKPMAGILIYTSASDSEGTLGSLSEMPILIFSIHSKTALKNIEICSHDPIVLMKSLL